MQRLIIKSIHEHGFGFAFTHKEHDQVYLPRKLLLEAGITSLKPADEIIGEVIPNYIDKLDGGCKYICTEIGYAHRFSDQIEPMPRGYASEIEYMKQFFILHDEIKKSDKNQLRSNLYNSFERIDPSLHRALFAEIDRPSLSVRTYNLIRNELDHMKIYNYDLLSYTPAKLLRIPNLGRTALYEVQNHLRKFGLELGTPLDQIKDKVMSSFIEHVSDTLAHIWKDQ
jgi:hypothetical protein